MSEKSGNSSKEPRNETLVFQEVPSSTSNGSLSNLQTSLNHNSFAPIFSWLAQEQLSFLKSNSPKRNLLPLSSVGMLP